MATLVGWDRAVKGARQAKSWRQTYLLSVIALTALLSVILWAGREASMIESRAGDVVSATLRLERAIGYVGFIHNFKNYVLRPQETRYFTAAQEDMVRALAALEELETLIAANGLDASLRELHATLDTYTAMLKRARALSGEGLTARELDARLRVPDDAAARDVFAFSEQIDRELEEQTSAFLRLRLQLQMSAAIFVIARFAIAQLYRSRERAEQQRLSRMFDTIGLHLGIVDPAGRFVFFNSAFGDLFRHFGQTVSTGDTLDDATRRITPFIAHEDVVTPPDAIAAGEPDIRDVTFTDGSVIRRALYRLDYGRQVILRRDVTEQHRREAEFNAERDRLIADLKRSNVELDNFADIASHDLREPLRGIAINAGFLLRKEELPETARARVLRIVEMCEREQMLMDSLLEFARLGRSSDQDDVINDPAAVVKQIGHDLISADTNRQGVIVLDTGLPPVSVDFGRLRSLFMNLIANGLKHNDSSRPEVHVGFLGPATGDRRPPRPVLRRGQWYRRGRG
ncbi:MAG: sensor histidine kinase [Sagittula sp.]|uniref:sensor histidine kinase n=1 Tax=Sagittula sp. TaxID=2038081 RepID=UPI004058E6CB